MVIPELLYSHYLRPGGRPPYVRVLSTIGSGTPATSFISIQAPDDADMIVQNIFHKYETTGGETINFVRYFLVPPPGTLASNYLVDEAYLWAGIHHDRNFKNMPTYWTRGSVFTVEMNKSAAVQFATWVLTAHGLCIPPMNL